jgi:tRNA(Ile)-lysidine synthase
LKKIPAETLALAHNLDDQAETVLMNLLRGAGRRGARGMLPRSGFQGKMLLRPLLDVPRDAIVAYAREHRLQWIEDESNADESLARNFIRRQVGPLLERRYPRWKENLARAARHFAREEAGAEELLRKFLKAKGLRAPSEAKLVEMLKQLTSGGSRTLIEHDGARLRVYRSGIVEDRGRAGAFTPAFAPIAWKGERRLAIPELGGELRFRRARGQGIDAAARPLRVRLRSGGERLQPDPRRPRRTLKNLFQEAGVPPWERDRLPLLVCGEDVVWVPGLGVDARYQAARNATGVLPEWRRIAG